jgi:hypothetical protein
VVQVGVPFFHKKDHRVLWLLCKCFEDVIQTVLIKSYIAINRTLQTLSSLLRKNLLKLTINVN